VKKPRAALCEHDRWDEYERTWESAGQDSGGEYEMQISHRRCTDCGSLHGRELWITKRIKKEKAA
jgi:hypothetical protein